MALGAVADQDLVGESPGERENSVAIPPVARGERWAFEEASEALGESAQGVFVNPGVDAVLAYRVTVFSV